MAILLLADHDGTSLSPQVARCLTAALAIGQDVDILVAGQNVQGVAESAASLHGARRVLLAQDAALEHLLPEPLAAFLQGLAGGYQAIVSPATSSGKNALPRLAALLDVMQVSELVAVLGPTTFKRPIYAGNALQTVEVTAGPVIATVRGAAFAPAATGAATPIETIAVPALPVKTRFKDSAVNDSDRPDLASARVIVSGGRAFGSKDQFDAMITPLAAKLGAAVGASRAAVDAGYAQNDLQVGQTGKVVAPDVYIACGISGAIQHLAGMKDSRIIVAINKDPDAPIFQIADYGFVGDVFDVLPALARAV